jgi:hypothetical protein
MKPNEFIDKINKDSKFDYGIFSPPTKAQDGLNILIEHFLGKEWYTVNPISQEQVNTEVIYDILRLYPKTKFK